MEAEKVRTGSPFCLPLSLCCLASHRSQTYNLDTVPDVFLFAFHICFYCRQWLTVPNPVPELGFVGAT